MTTHNIVQYILSLNKEDQEQIIDHYTLIKQLFSIYGSKLTNKNTITCIENHSKELSGLIISTASTIGFDQIDQLIKDYYSYSPEQITSTINPHNQLGIVIQSTHGKSYKRTLLQDISKLTHG